MPIVACAAPIAKADRLPEHEGDRDAALLHHHGNELAAILAVMRFGAYPFGADHDGRGGRDLAFEVRIPRHLGGEAVVPPDRNPFGLQPRNHAFGDLGILFLVTDEYIRHARAPALFRRSCLYSI